jgi:membrane-bound lytic murein transglycosylase D
MSLPRFTTAAVLLSLLAGCAEAPLRLAMLDDAGETGEADAGDDRIPRLNSSADGDLIETLLADYFRSLESPAVPVQMATGPASGAPEPARRLSGSGIRVIPVGPPKHHKNGLWHYLRERLELTRWNHPSVEAEVAGFRARPARVRGLAKRAEPFLHYLVGEIERRGLPLDLVLVPLVESACDPSALSAKTAAGLWQLIPATGQRFGVEMAADYDGRYDIHVSTGAALAYLQHLHDRFQGDWLLALAAYNAGEGAVQQAIANNRAAGRGTDFWSLPLPPETRGYVPKILALSRILAGADRYGLELEPVPGTPVLARVEIDAGIRPADVGSAAGLPEPLFKLLNPALKSIHDAPQRKYGLMLPLKNAQAMASSLEGAELVSAKTVVVKKGETLAVIAKRVGVSETVLAGWNGLAPNSRLKPGQELLIYPA